MRHIPVLHDETIASLNLSAGAIVIDGTLGDAGHSELIAKKIGKRGTLLGLDLDPESLLRAKKFLDAYQNTVTLVRDSFRNIIAVAATHQIEAVDAVLLDLGWSSPQFAQRGRGFSFQQDEPLNMRYDGKQDDGVVTAKYLLATNSATELALIFSRYGEEKHAQKIARAIVQARRKTPINTTTQLVQIIEMVYGKTRGKIHPATKVFQALRIAVNDEFEALKDGLVGAAQLLRDGGRLAVITFHSGEDRIVKRFMQLHPQLEIVTKKPITASAAERAQNPRARSAKLRVAQKTST